MKIFPRILWALIFILPLISCEGETPPQQEDPSMYIGDLAIAEGNTDNAITLKIEISATSDKEISVSYATAEGTAKAGEDFEAVENTLVTFAPGEKSKEISIMIIADEFREENETFEVHISDAVNANITRPTSTVTISNDDQAVDVSTLAIPTTGFTSPTSYAGMTLVWQDEFQGPEISDDWVFEVGNGCDKGICGWGNNELQYYREENASIAADEYLAIQAFKEDFGGESYTSARMITQGKKAFQFGRVDIRAAMPTGQGMWPALWMLGSNINQVSWPACGEIDIMEIIGNEPDKCHGTVHWDNGGNYASFGQSIESSSSLNEEFHVYSIIWDEKEIRWLLDDVQYNSIDISSASMDEFRQEFFLIFNVAVGGNWPGQPNSLTEFPQRMLVDYIRVFQ